MDKAEFYIEKLLELKGWDLETAAKHIGDSPARLSLVLEGKEELGKTATLAIIAVINGLEPIENNL